MKITVDIDRVVEFLDEFKTKALISAARKSMNRTVMMLRTRANRLAREERKLKSSELNKDFFKVKKAYGNNLGALQASLQISGRPMSLIRFVVGPKQPIPQQGIPVRSRKNLKVEVKPGRRVALSTAFIARGRGGNLQVFRRQTKASFPIMKQSVPALSRLFEKDPNKSALEKFGHDTLGSEFDRVFKFELERIMDRRR